MELAEWMAVGMAALAALGQGINVVLNLKLRTAVLESEDRVLNKVSEVYKRQDVCTAEMNVMEACPQIRALRQQAN